MSKESIMKQVGLEKVTVNMGVGQGGEELEKAVTILTQITGAKPLKTLSKIRQPTWGIREGLPIGAKVTLRKKKAADFLKKALQAKENRLSAKSFDRSGNFGFGIREYIELPGAKYDPALGIRGLDVLVTLARPGYRIKRRKLRKQKVPLRHRILKEDAIRFAREKLGVDVQ
ncbi:MAG: 50S ribosomal protein L5 [Candidatus Diapherotrites archaeon]|nr:50S ribosomal protein L5 [Candidatus Diapherotrites archaeon]